MLQYRPTRFNQWDAADRAMPRVFYGGGKSQTSTSSVSIPPEVLAQYENANSIANKVAQTPFQQYSTDPSAFVAPLTPTQQAGIVGTNQYSTEAQPFFQQASNLNTPAGVQSYMNPEASYVQNLMKQQFNQAQSQQLGNAIQNGAFGGDRAAVTAANLQGQQGLAYGNAMAGIYNNAVQNSQAASNLEANIGSGAQAAGLAGAQAQLTAGQAQQQTEQAGLTALYNQFLQQQSYPFQTTQFLANIAEGTGALSGSTTSSTSPAPYFSDERLKEDIEPIGKTYDGLNIIKFRYKGQKQPHIGLSAQEVEQRYPHAVGLAGGYKTVDYDAATRNAAKASEGGEVIPFSGRRGYDSGGLAGFTLDPAYLEAQEQAYVSAPWGNAGVGAMPYGGRSHVPPLMNTGHAALAVAKPPAEHGGSGLQQISQSVGQLEGLGKAGKSLWNDVKGYVPGASTSSPTPANSNAPSASASAPAPAASPPPSNDASAGPVAGLSPSDIGGPPVADASLGLGLDNLGSDIASRFSKRGGLIHRASGGDLNYSNPTDSQADDQSGGGAVPYQSGTGSGGLDIPDDKSNNKLAVAQPPSQSGGGGGFNPLSILTGALGLFGLADGGRVGLAGGGSAGDIVLPSLNDEAQPGFFDQGTGVAPPAHQSGPWHYAGSPTNPIIDDPEDTTAPPPDVKFPDPNATAGLAPASRDIFVHKAAPKPQPAPAIAQKDTPAPAPAPKAGLNPDAPTPDAQPVQAIAPRGSQGHVTEPGEVLNQDNPGGIGDFLNRNQGLLVPLMHGLGTMASSNSRYLGSAILQGLAGAADSYENVQDEMQQRHGLQPIITAHQAESLNTQLTGLAQFNAMNGTNLSLPEYQQYLNTGKMPSRGGAGASGSPMNGGPQSMGNPSNPQSWTFSPYERDHMIINGVPAYNDPRYMTGFTNKWSALANTSPYFHGMVEQGNHTVGQIGANNFTYNNLGDQVTPSGYQSRVMAQNQPAVMAEQAKNFQNEGISFMNEYGRSMSLFNELGDVYQNLRAGPTADWRASVSRLANDFDPDGQYPFLHNIPAGNDAANYDKAKKDIAQLTASRLQSMPGGAPRAETELLGQFAANPHLSPDALRDIVIRGKAYLQQQHDYYSGFDPFGNGAKGVNGYALDFYEHHPFDDYRARFEKQTPRFSGGTEGQASQAGAAQNSAPAGAPSGARRAPDGNWYVPDPSRPGKYLRVD